jgi:hypothetical protein
MPLVDLQDPEKGFLVDDILQLKVEIQVQVCTFPGSSSSSGGGGNCGSSGSCGDAGGGSSSAGCSVMAAAQGGVMAVMAGFLEQQWQQPQQYWPQPVGEFCSCCCSSISSAA